MLFKVGLAISLNKMDNIFSGFTVFIFLVGTGPRMTKFRRFLEQRVMRMKELRYSTKSLDGEWIVVGLVYWLAVRYLESKVLRLQRFCVVCDMGISWPLIVDFMCIIFSCFTLIFKFLCAVNDFCIILYRKLRSLAWYLNFKGYVNDDKH